MVSGVVQYHAVNMGGPGGFGSETVGESCFGKAEIRDRVENSAFGVIQT